MIRDRVKELRRVPASEIRDNPRNWRGHPDEQRSALRIMLEKIGFAAALVAREDDDGTLVLIDGHLRRDMVDDQAVPVLVLDVSEEEADMLLATLDPLSTLATTDKEALQALLSRVDLHEDALAKMFEKVMADPALSDVLANQANGSPNAAPQLGGLQHKILVECDDEQQAVALLERLEEEGYTCRPWVG